MDEDRQALALMLLEEGSTEQAIRLYQEETGTGYFEARQRVDELADRHGLARHPLSRWVMFLLLLATCAGFLMSH